MDTKNERPIPRLPTGFADAFAAKVRSRNQMIGIICATYERFGFEPLETSAIEYADVLGKFLPDAELPTGGVFAFRDSDGSKQWLSLRYDLTAPLARVYAQYEKLQAFAIPYRRFQVGPVWRDEKPGPGRFRQFYQCDFDTVGTNSVAADAEVCAVLASAFDALGIGRDSYEIKVNNRKVLNGVLERAEIRDEEQRLTVLRALDKLDRLGRAGVAQLLGEGREDESGDFAKGAGLDSSQQSILLHFVGAGAASRLEVCNNFAELVGSSEVGREGVAELRQIHDLVDAMQLPESLVKFDPSLVRGLAYYTGPVFEAGLTFKVTDHEGVTRSFGSVAGGGRYDDLVMRFTGQRVPATGASIGVDRLLAALDALGKASDQATKGPVVVTVMDRARLVDYQAMVTELRLAGIAAELYLGDPKKFGRQLEYADARRSPLVIIVGGNEFSGGTVSIKDLRVGETIAAELTRQEDAAEYQRRVQEAAQTTVARRDLVAEVRRILGRSAGEEN